ncbi:MAG: M28 family peptidase [Bacteroidales bacterium]|nr:M28 family peptidase [Bacteroidales bacterium]
MIRLFRFSFLLFPFFLFPASCTDLDPEDEVIIEVEKEESPLEKQGRQWLETLCSEKMMGRRIGTKGGANAYEFLVAELGKFGLTPVTQEFNAGNGLLARNIIITIPGQIDSSIVIGAHYDGANESYDDYHYPAANDNASGCVALLHLIQQCILKPVPTKYTIVFCFWDGEEVYEDSSYKGSRYYLQNNADIRKILFYINLDCIGHKHKDHPEVYLSFNGNERLKRTASKITQSNYLDLVISLTPGRLNSDNVPFNSNGIPYLYFHDHNGFSCPNPSHSLADSPIAISISRLIGIASCVKEAIADY